MFNKFILNLKFKFMKTTKFIALALVAALAFSCEKQKITMDDPSADMNGVSTLITDMNQSYLIISKNDKLPAGLEKSLAKANGVLERSFPEIGIAIASSSDPGFKGKSAKIQGVGEVVPNPKLQLVDPDLKIESLDTEANPPSIGDFEPYFWIQWGHDAIDAPEAWNAGYFGEEVRVGVLDGGFDWTHPDLSDNINKDLSTDFTGEGNAYAGGWHGTHTAGTIAALSNNFGVIGVAPSAELVLIKVLEADGSGSFGAMIAGIYYAADNDVDVINMSIGATFSHRGGVYQDGELVAMINASEVAGLVNAVSRAVRYAYQNGTTVIASAGNESTDYDHSADRIHLPSGVPFALSISATGPLGWYYNPDTDLDVPAYYTNFGQSAIDFAAPGGNVDFNLVPDGPYSWDMVLSTVPGGWAWASGTSMASPHATGVAALIIGKNGGSMKPAQVKAALRASADDLGKPGNDDFYGQGRVNAYRAVTN